MSPESTAARGRQIVVCGLGGQGIVFLARLVAQAAVLDGEEVLTAETHGMAQRGGAVEAHLKLGDFQSSLVRPGSADTALALDASRLAVARAFLRSDGACFANAPAPPEEEGSVRAVDASRIAREMAFPRGQNLVLLGYATALEPDRFPSRDAIRSALEALSPPAAVEDNRRAFGHGGDLA